MQKRKFGRQGSEVPVLGFGAMRMPTLSPESRELDESLSVALLRHAIDKGISYLDTAYSYHGGRSEAMVAKALAGGRRDEVMVATKLPHWLVEKPEDMDRLLGEQLERLQTAQVDCYLLHALNKESWPKLCGHDVLAFLDRARADGRIKYAGFSFHDRLPLFKQIVDAYDWDCCLIQLNYMDVDSQAGIEGLRYAAGRGLAVQIMEPLLGGRLAGTQPEEVRAVWARAPVGRTPAEWGLRWVWNQPEVTTVLSGMNTMEQIEENSRIAGEAWPCSLSSAELDLIREVREIYRRRTKVNCTGCGYCLPCPAGVRIRDIFYEYNQAAMYDLPRRETQAMYQWFAERQGDASRCTDCGQCEAACPQTLNVREALRDIHLAFGD